MDWMILFIAGLLEIVWAIGLKYSQGFTKLGASLLTIIAMLLSFWFLSLSMRTLPLGTAYAVWTGIGTIGTVIFGIFWFNEPVSLLRLLCLFSIILGIFGLKWLN